MAAASTTLVGAFPSTSHAGLHEILSQGAYYLSTETKTCESVSDENVKSAIAKAGRICANNSFNTEASQLPAAEANDLLKLVSNDAESGYFGLLGLQHAQELSCASAQAREIASGTSPSISNLKYNLKLLRLAKQDLIAASQELASRSDLPEKVCPADLEELKPNPIRTTGTGRDDYYELCSMILSNRLAVQAIEGAIPLSGLPSVQVMMDRYAGASESELLEIERQLDSSITATYTAAAEQTKSEGKSLEAEVKRHGGKGFNRSARMALLSDPAIVEAVIEASGDERNMRALACTAESRYGIGAQKLDTTLLVGSLLLSGGASVVARGTAIAARAANGAKAARAVSGARAAQATRSLSLHSAHLLQRLAVSVDILSLSEQIDRTCPIKAGRSLKVRGTDGKRACVSSPSAEELTNDQCILQAALAGIGFTAVLAPSVRFGKATSRMKNIEIIYADALKGIPRDEELLNLIAKAEDKGWKKSDITEAIKKARYTCPAPR